MAVVLWLMVAKHESIHPTEIDGWRCQGFGLFLIIAMIKHCFAVHSTEVKKVEVYLQCYEAASFDFYNHIGFVKINKHYNDGFALLPSHARQSVSVVSELPGVSMFH